VAAFDGSAVSGRALDAASRLAEAARGELVVVVLAEAEAASGRLRERLEAALAAPRERLRVRHVVGRARFAPALRAERKGLLVLGAPGGAIDGVELLVLLEQTGGAVLLVR
jgi:hypothetical protein